MTMCTTRHHILSRAALEARRVAADVRQPAHIRNRCLQLFRRIKSHAIAI
jgi:hypothetical protein